MITVASATEEHCFQIRNAEKTELILMGVSEETPILSLCVQHSSLAFTILYNGEAVSMFGVSPYTASYASAWMLSSSKLANIKIIRQIYKQSRSFISKMFDSVPEEVETLFNYVHHDNKLALKLIKKMGFTIGRDVYFNNKKFLFVYIKRGDICAHPCSQ
jgi:hypothetical protein